MGQPNIENPELFHKIVVGRVEPHIYAFSTATVPNYLKVGDTYRPLETRLDEWRAFFPNLVRQYDATAMVDEEAYFRDYAVHRYLEYKGGKTRLTPDYLRNYLSADLHYSNEFFRDTQVDDVRAAIDDIKESYRQHRGEYQFYTGGLPEEYSYARDKTFAPRPNQQEAIDKFKQAVDNGRTNLLMYAVMRFGKSFTAMCCATEMNARVVVVVSAKADVAEEWKRTVESHTRFADFVFLNSSKLKESNTAISDTLNDGKNVALFLTLQDLHGEKIKRKHEELFNGTTTIDLLIVDETHFGARGEKYGEVLRQLNIKSASTKKEPQEPKEEGVAYLDDLSQHIKVLNATVRLHLSGTPYRILMSSEFQPDDIIAFCQYTDITDAQAQWDKDNLDKDGVNEWDNPYYGFPQMVRFAFHPNASARRKLEEFKHSGITYAFSALFQPLSIEKDDEQQRHKHFRHEQEILDLLAIIDGTKHEEGMLGFLDYDNIKRGKMCRHIVCVLPFCASCDAMEALIAAHRAEFTNLCEYEIINISGVDDKKKYRNARAIKEKIKACERNDKKTLTLTVNRMLTGSTVEEWDTMIYLKDTASPQEYDQAIFRLQNQYIREYKDDEGHTIKYNMKPQTLLVDFDPTRMFYMQEQKAQVYNVNTEHSGNEQLQERIRKELAVSPIITINANRIEQIAPADILAAVSNYSRDKSVTDEATAIAADFALLDDPALREMIERQAPLGTKQGMELSPATGEGTDLAIPDDGAQEPPATEQTAAAATPQKKDDEAATLAKKFATFYSRILFLAFLTKDAISSLEGMIAAIDRSDDNQRIAKHLSLDSNILQRLREKINPFILRDLDYKIQNLNTLANDTTIAPVERAERAMKKFVRLSASEIVTPPPVADEMVALLPQDMMDGTATILDIASKQGEFVYAIYKRYGEDVARNVYSIPTSAGAYEFTRKVYDLLGLDVAHIESTYNAYDLIKGDNPTTKGSKAKTKASKAATKGDKPMIKGKKIKINGHYMKFNAVVGNPPYQEEGISTSQQPIYHLFMDVAFALSDKATLITPGRFLFHAGQTSAEWMDRILADTHFKVVDYFKKSDEVFPAVDIKGGVAITMYDATQDFGAIGFFSEFKELNSIKEKVWASEPQSLSTIILNRGQYRYSDKAYTEEPDELSKTPDRRISTSAFERMPRLFTEEKPNNGYDYIQMYGNIDNKRVYRWFRKDYLNPIDNLYKYKVLVPKANGSGAIGEVLSTPLIGEPLIGEPLIGYTETYISIGCVDTLAEAEAILKYVKTKFARCLLGLLKVTQDNTKKTWRFVPLQDFTSEGDIDWRKSVAEIDQQLYAKYGLSADEQQFIETMIKPM